MGRRLRYLPYDRTLVEITNRTIHGRFLLEPKGDVRSMCVGALGRAQRRFEVEIHALCFLSNHYHLLITVENVKQMADFVGYFQSKIAREIARNTGWNDKIWARRYTAIAVSNEEAAQIERLDYALSQGVKEGLVSHPADWWGAHSVDALLHGTPLEGVWYDRTAEFQARSRHKRVEPDDFAEAETVEITPLPCWKEKATEWVRRCVGERIKSILAAARSEGRRHAKLLAHLRPTQRPQHSKRSPAPWFHCASHAVRKELRRAYGEFVEAYRAAAEHWLRGELTAPFPDGCFPPPRPFVAG